MLTEQDIRNIKWELSDFICSMENMDFYGDFFSAGEDVDDFLNERKDTLPFAYDYSFGCTKLVIIPEDENYVIKIPFNSGYSYDEEDYIFFSHADCPDKMDYCSVEASYYSYAQQYGFERFFMPTYLINGGFGCKYPIYVQEKVEVYNDLEWSGDIEKYIPSAESMKAVKELNSDGRPFSYLRAGGKWKASLYENFIDDDEREEFFQFMEDFSFIFEDLHNNNIGYKDGLPVIFDYSGYNEADFQISEQTEEVQLFAF